jgi:periplasmic protein TonB
VANPASSAPRSPDSGSSGSPAPTPSATQRATVDLTALTNRDDFLLELGEALGGQASVNPVDSIDSAIEQLASTKRGQMLVIDARTASDVRSDVHRATQEAPHAVVVVFAEADAEKQVASAVKGTSVFAVLTIPIEGPKTMAVLDAAIADAASRSAAARGTGAERAGGAGSAGALTLDAFRPAMSYSTKQPDEPQPEEGRKWGLWVGLGLAAVALAAGGAWYFTHGNKASAPGTAAQAPGTLNPAGAVAQSAAVLPQPAVDTSIVAGRVDDLLEKARRAMRDRRYTAPTGDNALVFYRSAAAADPTSGEAKDGLRRVGDVCISRFNDAMSADHYNDAALALATLKLAEPSDPHLGAFQLQLSAAEINQAVTGGHANRAAALLRQAEQAGVPAAQLASWRAQVARLQQTDKVQSLVTAARDRIRAGQLTSPAGDSAAAYLSQLRAVAPASPETAEVASALVAACFSKAQQHALAGDTAAESRWLAEARASGASAGEVAQFQRQLAGAQAKAAHLRADRLVTLIRERLGSGALTSPAGDSAADYLQQLEGSHPAGNAAAAAVQDKSALAAKLLARARAEMRARNPVQANADLTAARNWGANAAAVAAVQRLGSSSAAAARPAAGPDLVALASQLKRVRYAPPEYPDRALNDRISGSVIVQYVVDKRGYTQDIKVTQSTPPGVFDDAAIDSIRRWRYRPAQYHGRPVEVPVRTLIRFVLPH